MKRVLRWIGIVLGGLLVLILVLAVIFYIQGIRMQNRIWDIEVAALDIPSDEATIAEGERVFITRGCGGCHGEDAGGRSTFEIPLIASLYASNLTVGGVGAYYEPADFMRAIMHGVGADGRALVEMPSTQFQTMRIDEIVPLIAYLQSLPAVEGEPQETEIYLLGQIVAGTGLFPPPAAYQIDHETVQLDTDTAEVSLENGEILAMQMCMGCHRENLAGGLFFDGVTVVPNITFHEEGIAGWTQDDFITAIRTGETPDGEQIEDPMPWQAFALLTDEELESIYLYLETVEQLPQGD